MLARQGNCMLVSEGHWRDDCYWQVCTPLSLHCNSGGKLEGWSVRATCLLGWFMKEIAYWFMTPACMLVQVKVKWQNSVIDNTKLDRELLDLPPNKVKAMTITQQK